MEEETAIPKPSFEDTALLALTGAMIMASLCFVIYGLTTVYVYNDDGKVVGGDAYNFIIIGLRGLAWICTGLTCAVLAVLFAGLRK